MSSILFTFIKIFYFYLTIKRRRSRRPNATTLIARKGFAAEFGRRLDVSLRFCYIII
nr:MAG TPA: hypothetical protein [Caudoviricetes sp.]